jgi:phage host-nuclease inhibitor protein Gam
MNKRIKLNGPALRSRTELEVTLQEIRDLTIARNKVALDRETAIAEIDARVGPFLQDMTTQLTQKTEVVRAWAEANPSEFNGLKSLDTTHAVIGWRTGQPTLKTLAGWTWDRVLKKLSMFAPAAVRVKEEVNKQQLIAARETLGDELLRDLGVRVVQDESFFVEPKLEEIENRQEA